MFKFNNKDTRTTPLASFTLCSSVSTVNFEQVNADSVNYYYCKFSSSLLIHWKLLFIIDVASLVTSYIEHSMGSEKRSILDEFEELLLKELVEKRNYEKRKLFVVVCYFYFASISSDPNFFLKRALSKFQFISRQIVS